MTPLPCIYQISLSKWWHAETTCVGNEDYHASAVSRRLSEKVGAISDREADLFYPSV
jgi:hypothetical protein